MRKGTDRESGESASRRPPLPSVGEGWGEGWGEGEEKSNHADILPTFPPLSERGRRWAGFQIETRPETKPRPAQNRNHSDAAWMTW